MGFHYHAKETENTVITQFIEHSGGQWASVQNIECSMNRWRHQFFNRSYRWRKIVSYHFLSCGCEMHEQAKFRFLYAFSRFELKISFFRTPYFTFYAQCLLESQELDLKITILSNAPVTFFLPSSMNRTISVYGRVCHNAFNHSIYCIQ